MDIPELDGATHPIDTLTTMYTTPMPTSVKMPIFIHFTIVLTI